MEGHAMKRMLALLLVLPSLVWAAQGMGPGPGLSRATGGADTTPPTVSTATIGTSGTTMTLAMSEAVSIGAGGSGGFTPTLSGGAASMTYSSGSGTSSLVYTLGRTVNSGETGTLAYVQPGNGVEDTSGNDLASFSGKTVTNNSTQSALATYSDNFNRADEDPLSGGGNWTTVSGIFSLVVHSSLVQGHSDRAGGYYSGGTFNSDQWSQLKLVTFADGNIGPTVRVQPGVQTMYMAVTVGTAAMRVRKDVAGSITQVGSDIPTTAFGSGDTIKLTASGSSSVTLSVYLNGVLQGSVTDSSSPITGGKPGIWMYDVYTGDDWAGGDL